LAAGVRTYGLAWADSYDTIVIEGCDGAGKSTLAVQVAGRTGAKVIHSCLSPPGTDLLAVYARLLDRPGRLVFDRCFLSEAVYGPILRGESRLTDTQIADLVGVVAERNGVFVHLTAAPTELLERLRQRGETSQSDLDRIIRIVQRYDDLFKIISQKAATIRIDTTTKR
jgi:thymidylate kinase